MTGWGRAGLPILLMLLLIGGARGAESADTDADYWSARQQLDQSHQANLAALAVRCRELGLAEQAAATADWFIPRDPRRQYVFLPPPIDPLAPAADAPAVVHQWYAQLMRHRHRQAEQLFLAARQQLERGRAARAYQLLHEVLHEDPDHADARQALGYRQVSGQWARPAAVLRSRQVRSGSAARGFAEPHWVIESENFSIATNHSEQAGRQLAERLETLHAVWQQLFLRYWSSAAALTRRIDGQGAPPRGGPRHNVILFRNRQEYLNQLKANEPLIELTIGFYHDAARTAYFYWDEDAEPDVYYHEVTHQLFSETGRVAPGTGREGNFWIVEGIALYMESLRTLGGYCTVGGIDASRLQYARYRLLNDDFYVPLEQLVQLGRRALQEHPEIRMLYSQAAGLTAMLMDHRRGVYQEPLVDYLQAVYSGRDRAATLASLVDAPLADLDAQYRQFLNVTDDDLAHLTPMPVARQLSLGHTAVTDRGLEHLAGHTQLQWLDLAATGISDAGIRFVNAATRLNHLIVEQTRITDASLPIIGRFKNLEILDLTGTAITDEGLAHLSGLSHVRELWLGGTAISDAGLEHLHALKRLETLDVSGTRVTAAGWKRLRTKLPSFQQ